MLGSLNLMVKRSHGDEAEAVVALEPLQDAQGAAGAGVGVDYNLAYVLRSVHRAITMWHRWVCPQRVLRQRVLRHRVPRRRVRSGRTQADPGGLWPLPGAAGTGRSGLACALRKPG